jgi:hypothetical protein
MKSCEQDIQPVPAPPRSTEERVKLRHSRHCRPNPISDSAPIARASRDAYRTNAEYRPKSPEQMAVEIRYQGFVRERLRNVITGTMDRNEPLPESIPADDRALVAKMIQVQMETLHPGRAAPLGVTSAAIEAYLQRTTAETRTRDLNLGKIMLQIIQGFD